MKDPQVTASLLNLVACLAALAITLMPARSFFASARNDKEGSTSVAPHIQWSAFLRLWLAVWATWSMLWALQVVVEASGIHGRLTDDVAYSLGTLNSILVLACGLVLLFGNRLRRGFLATSLGTLWLLLLAIKLAEPDPNGAWFLDIARLLSLGTSVAAMAILAVGFAQGFGKGVLVIPVLLYGLMQPIAYAIVPVSAGAHTIEYLMYLFVLMKLILGISVVSALRASPRPSLYKDGSSDIKRSLSYLSLLSVVFTCATAATAGMGALVLMAILGVAVWDLGFHKKLPSFLDIADKETASGEDADSIITRMYDRLSQMDAGTPEYAEVLRELRQLQEIEAARMTALFEERHAFLTTDIDEYLESEKDVGTGEKDNA